ncbi:unnamed protein product [Arctogadus glacialis]
MLQLSLPVAPLLLRQCKSSFSGAVKASHPLRNDIEGALAASLREVFGANTKLAFASTPRKVPPASMRDGVPGPYHPCKLQGEATKSDNSWYP